MNERAEEKRRIRRTMRHRRRALGAVVQRRHALRLKTFIQHRSWFQNARALGFYCATDGEISLAPLIALCRQRGKRVYLPCVERQRKMIFRLLRSDDSLRRNRFGIQEPPLHAPTVKLESLDIIFVPMVAFTDTGGRLGMGGGFYDRALSRYSRAKPSRRQRQLLANRSGCFDPLLVGVAHSCQRIEALPWDDWDIAMDLVVTEQGRWRARGINPNESPPR